jgi:diadenosine tetraphosphatase ApaH/serine/threonine PP2A family protein phosphatase
MEAREPLLALARKFQCVAVAIVFKVPEELCQDRARQRTDRNFSPQIISRQYQDLERSLPELRREGFRTPDVLVSPEQIDKTVVERQTLRSNLRHEHGPFDVNGDVHGCFDELLDLLQRLGYETKTEPIEPDVSWYKVHHPQRRRAIFLGDLVDRGPKIPQVLNLVMDMVESGAALCLPGNHDVNLLGRLKGKSVEITHGLAESLAQLEHETPGFSLRVTNFIEDLVSHYILDDGRLVVAHAGMKQGLQGRDSRKVRDFALYGETTGESDEFGLPARVNWATEYRGKAVVIYGHTPVPKPKWLNRTINIDTGCVFGGRLTALRYPEMDWVSVPAARAYFFSFS